MSKKRGKYDEWLTYEGLILIEGWAKDGLIDRQIAHNIGVAERTFTRWKNDHPSIMSALKQGKEVADRQVENAMHMSAIGFKYTEEMVANTGEVVEVTKYSKPNTTAQIFWLKNRKHEWTDKQELDITLPTFIDDVDE